MLILLFLLIVKIQTKERRDRRKTRTQTRTKQNTRQLLSLLLLLLYIIYKSQKCRLKQVCGISTVKTGKEIGKKTRREKTNICIKGKTRQRQKHLNCKQKQKQNQSIFTTKEPHPLLVRGWGSLRPNTKHFPATK